MKRLPAIAAILTVTVFAGCKDVLEVSERTGGLPFQFSTNGSGQVVMSPRIFPADAVFVTGVVQRIELPLVNSPSIAGDKATCLLCVPINSIPRYPQVSRVLLHYDNHAWLTDMQMGMSIDLVFSVDGTFCGVNMKSGAPNKTSEPSVAPAPQVQR